MVIPKSQIGSLNNWVHRNKYIRLYIQSHIFIKQNTSINRRPNKENYNKTGIETNPIWCMVTTIVQYPKSSWGKWNCANQWIMKFNLFSILHVKNICSATCLVTSQMWYYSFSLAILWQKEMKCRLGHPLPRHAYKWEKYIQNAKLTTLILF